MLPVTVFLALLGLLGGCSSESDGDASGRAGKATGPSRERGASPSASGAAKNASKAPDYTLDPAKVPHTSAQALKLARRVAADPEDYGEGFVRGTPFESDTGSWAVLDKACAFRREPLPKGVLTSLSQHFVLPAAGGRGLVQATSVITVHGSVDSADQELATTLEEALRCPDQRLDPGERVSDLYSSGSPFGARGQKTSDDQIFEFGTYESDARGGPYPYIWGTARLGPVTVSVTVRGGRGYGEDKVSDFMQNPLVVMQEATKGELS